jgi:hypothetical protein
MSTFKPRVIVVGKYIVKEQPFSYCNWGVWTKDGENIGECFHKNWAIKWAEELNKEEIKVFQGCFAPKYGIGKLLNSEQNVQECDATEEPSKT